MNGMVILTQYAGEIKKGNYFSGDSWRYISQANIVAIDPGKPEKPVKLLTGGFYSALSPDISYDAGSMLFSAQQKQNDPWQIWEMNLNNMKIKQVFSSLENCIDPAYLPGGRILFSKIDMKETMKAGHSLYTCNLDGSDLKRVTFNPHTYFASSVLKDGRVVTISRQLFPDNRDPVLMVLRPDGTKSELFYKGLEGSILQSRIRETTNGNIIFTESDSDTLSGGNLISVKYNRPLHSRVNLTSEIKGSFGPPFPLNSGKLMVSYRSPEAKTYSLYEFDPDKKSLGSVLYSNADYNVLEAVAVETHDRPKKLPSEVDFGVKSGLLFCQDINFTDPLSVSSVSVLNAGMIEVLGIDSTLGVVNVEKDGSVYLKVIADTPFRIQTIDEKGKVLNGPGGWIWLRPNERRGCVGCHEDREIVPENRLSMSVKNPPVVIPVHISKIAEKKISLE